VRIGITGGPLTGKTTLANELARKLRVNVFHVDDVKYLPWKDQPQEIIKRAPPNGILEGVQVARAVRKGLAVDFLVVLDFPLKQPTPKQLAMSRGLETILKSIQGCSIVRCASPRDAQNYIEEYAFR